MGIISPYRFQLKIIKRLFEKYQLHPLDIHTIDRFQGKDKACMLVSLVRSNSQGHVSFYNLFSTI
jgi:DNA replication ATP-dependent helicase Dna2